MIKNNERTYLKIAKYGSRYNEEFKKLLVTYIKLHFVIKTFAKYIHTGVIITKYCSTKKQANMQWG